MKKIYSYIIILAAILAYASPAPAQQIDFAVPDTHFSLRGDTLRINARIEGMVRKVRSREWMRVEFSLKGNDRELILPAVVYSGGQRYLFERRKQMVSAEFVVPDYHTYRKLKSDSTYTLDYSVAVPYYPWMEHAAFTMKQFGYGCQAEFPIASAVLLGDINVLPPLYEPEPWVANKDVYAGMILFVTPQVEAVKKRSESVSAHIDFKRGSYQILPEFGKNPEELNAVDSMLRKVIGNDMININSISITGYASPEGSYAANEQLSRRRSMGFRDYLISKYSLPSSKFKTSWVAEDWDGLTQLIEEREMPYKDEILSIIQNVSVMDYREKKIMALGGGAPYIQMLNELFPQLRRIELQADYVVLPMTDEQARELLFSRPDMLSHEEMTRAARYYKPGTPEYRMAYETAARYYPNDFIANNNAAAALLEEGNVAEARRYLMKSSTDPRSYINIGTYFYILGDFTKAEEYFLKAKEAGVEKADENLKLVRR